METSTNTLLYKELVFFKLFILFCFDTFSFTNYFFFYSKIVSLFSNAPFPLQYVFLFLNSYTLFKIFFLTSLRVFKYTICISVFFFSYFSLLHMSVTFVKLHFPFSLKLKIVSAYHILSKWNKHTFIS